MRALTLFVALLAATNVNAYEHSVSRDGKFEAYTTARWPNGTGMKLFLRRAQTRDEGVLLWQNDRWIKAKWSPNSRFLALVSHPDGHISDVYVFGVTAANATTPPTATLLYHTPNPGTYDVQWDVVGWRLKSRSIILKKEFRFGVTQETIVAPIGTTPLKAVTLVRPNHPLQPTPDRREIHFR
jgi:hypothetical protein